jgi:hypothetical protein
MSRPQFLASEQIMVSFKTHNSHTLHLFNFKYTWPLRQSSWPQIERSRVWFPVLPDFLRSSGSGTRSTQPRQDNLGAILKKTTAPVWKIEINGRGDKLWWPCDTLYPQKLVPTSPTSGGRSVGVIRLRTTGHGICFFFHCVWRMERAGKQGRMP